MKNFKRLFLALLVSLLFCGCGDDVASDETGAAFITPAATEFVFDNNAVYKEIGIEANTAWSVETEETWISCAKMGENKLAIAVPEYKSWTEDREGVVSLFDANGEVRAMIRIKQLKIETAPIETKKCVANGVEFNMIYVKGGTFDMGATKEQEKFTVPNGNEYPVHKVTLSDFFIGETEVTQALWSAVMGAAELPQWTSQYGLGNNYPAYYISDVDCQEFVERLNALTGETFRLPTEAEWEYAARGGVNSRGFVFSGSNSPEVAWYRQNYHENGTATHEVGTKWRNELAIYDMSGNVFEWVSDWYSSGYGSEPQTNPTGGAECPYRMVRGGCWNSFAAECRVSYRGVGNHGERNCYFGMRLALSSLSDSKQDKQ